MTHSLDVMEIFGPSAEGCGLMAAADMAILSVIPEGIESRGRGLWAGAAFADVLALGCLVGSGARPGGAGAFDSADAAVGAPEASFWPALDGVRDADGLLEAGCATVPDTWDGGEKGDGARGAGADGIADQSRVMRWRLRWADGL